MQSPAPFRVLSLDGGGMRGAYTATYLDRVAATFARRRNVQKIDVGAAFNLIAGTSTGAVIACALSAGVDLVDIVDLYQRHGPHILPRRLPQTIGFGLIRDLVYRSSTLAKGTREFREALTSRFGDETMGSMFARRKIALAIPAVELSQHRSWVFKTPHLASSTNHRDDNYRLVDVCLASSAAPVFRSMAAIDHPDEGDSCHGYHVFVDGGLWANNPVLVGLVDALQCASPDQAIEIFCLGTCPRPAGEQVHKESVHRGLPEWRFGGAAASLSIDAQEFAFDNIARMLAKHVNRPCSIVRFPREQVPAALMPFLDLDDTRAEAMRALINQARTDADMTNSRCADPNDREGSLINSLFMSAAAKPP